MTLRRWQPCNAALRPSCPGAPRAPDCPEIKKNKRTNPDSVQHEYHERLLDKVPIDLSHGRKTLRFGANLYFFKTTLFIRIINESQKGTVG